MHGARGCDGLVEAEAGDIHIGHGQWIDEEVTDHGSHALMTGVRAIDHVGQIEQDAVRLRRGTENGAQQVPSAASDAGDRP